MDDDEFDDLLAGVDSCPGSSQESLTHAAANLDINITGPPSTAPNSVHSQSESRPFIDDGAHMQIYREPTRLPGEISSFSSKPEQPPTPPTVAEKIERVFLNISDALATDVDQLCVVLRAKPSTAGAQSRPRLISFPGKTAKEAWRFSRSIHLGIRLDSAD